MKISALVPAIALAMGLAVAGPATAQDIIGGEPDFMIDGTPIPQEDVETFRQKCHLLYLAQMESLTSSSDVADDQDPLVTGSIGATNPDPASKANQLELLASISVRDCRAAGLL
jgi:hypothetical protein